MKPRILDTLALIIALSLAAPAQAEMPNDVEQSSAVNQEKQDIYRS